MLLKISIYFYNRLSLSLESVSVSCGLGWSLSLFLCVWTGKKKRPTSQREKREWHDKSDKSFMDLTITTERTVIDDDGMRRRYSDKIHSFKFTYNQMLVTFCSTFFLLLSRSCHILVAPDDDIIYISPVLSGVGLKKIDDGDN